MADPPDDGTPLAAPLDEVEAAVSSALSVGSDEGLRVLGYGEISLVIGWPTDSPAVACKRLPTFSRREDALRYRDLFGEYLDILTERGVTPVSSSFGIVEAADPRGAAQPDEPAVAAYVTQPVLHVTELGPEILRGAGPDADHALIVGIVDAVMAVCDDRTGLDAQVSNWAMVDGVLQYLDVTTPMTFDAAGMPRLNMAVFLAAYPWALRALIGRFVAPGVVGAYRDPRRVLVDCAANLYKERLDRWVPALVHAANARVATPITIEEVERYYRSDARLWEVMLRLRRADRWWQRRVRRRTYPFLLPGPIER